MNLDLLEKVFVTYLPPFYPYDVVGGQNQIYKTDFDQKVDIIPVADPNIFSQTQRIAIAQSELQIAMSNPQCTMCTTHTDICMKRWV